MVKTFEENCRKVKEHSEKFWGNMKIIIPIFEEDILIKILKIFDVKPENIFKKTVKQELKKLKNLEDKCEKQYSKLLKI